MPSSLLAFCKPWFASELKPLSLRPPVSVTRPTLMVCAEEPPPVLLVPPQAASTGSSSIRQVASATRRMRVRDMQSPPPPSRNMRARAPFTTAPDEDPARGREGSSNVTVSGKRRLHKPEIGPAGARPSAEYYAGKRPFLTTLGRTGSFTTTAWEVAKIVAKLARIEYARYARRPS